jgi:diguanylate cyclase (GGDEF)-like protein
MTRRHVVAGVCVLTAYVVAFALACMFLTKGSTALMILADGGIVLLEVAVLVLCVLAALRTKENRGRRVWALVAFWVLVNLVADSVWGYYELSQSADAVPLVTDVFYLASYAVAFSVVIVAATKTSGRLRTLETALDATMFTIGVAALNWPFLVGPLLDISSPGAELWITLGYPIGDLLIILGFATFFLGSVGSVRTRPRPYYLVLCVAFLCQIVADTAYWRDMATDADYVTGSWMDPVWLLAFAVVGIAALMEIRAAKEAADPSKGSMERSRRVWIQHSFTSGLWRILIPYVAITVLAGVLAMQLQADGWVFGIDTQVLTYLGAVLVGLLLVRQYVTLAQNRLLNVDLRHTSAQLEDKVGALADLNRRLETLNDQSHRLNALHDFHEVAEGGLELACSFARCPGGWVTAKDEKGREPVIATRGLLSQYHPGTPKLNAVGVAKGVLRAVPLETRGESLGTIWLVKPTEREQGADLLPVIATHVATALDNAKRYEEAVHLAERDALTGLYNHRGIHRRLAGEALRAQQSGSELSLVMMDLDDFKALNDTYGHPAGDRVLRQVSDAVRSVLRHADLAGRVGGDELLFVLPNTGADGALQLCDRLRNALAARPYVAADGGAVPVRFSLGLATYPGDAQSLGELIETADANLYASKQRGGDITTGSPPELQPKAVDAGGILGVAGRLLNAVGARDHYTRRHSEHVALYALSLGEAAGLSDDSLSTLHIAAMLHDVGKIGVPEDLLRKPGALAAGEEDLVRRHVDMSAAIINDMSRLAQVAQAVQAHHERYDGSGYPAETSGDDIPILGRVLAIADAYSAMTLDRPYRESLTCEQAREELLKAAGTQLDPELVRTFVQVLDAQGPKPLVSQAEAV